MNASDEKRGRKRTRRKLTKATPGVAQDCIYNALLGLQPASALQLSSALREQAASSPKNGHLPAPAHGGLDLQPRARTSTRGRRHPNQVRVRDADAGRVTGRAAHARRVLAQARLRQRSR